MAEPEDTLGIAKADQYMANGAGDQVYRLEEADPERGTRTTTFDLLQRISPSEVKYEYAPRFKEVAKKKPYVQPHLRIIELETKEVMAAGCKVHRGAVNFGMPHCGIRQGCVIEGS
jgi:hypothetical protein